MSLTVASSLNLRIDETSDLDLSDRDDNIRQTISIAMTDGTGANQANAKWSDSRTLTATSETLDLSGSLTKPLGGTLTLTKLKLLYIKNTHASSDLTIGGASQPVGLFADASDKIVIKPGGIFLWTAPAAGGLAISGGSTDGLKLDAGAATITYEIIVVGVE